MMRKLSKLHVLLLTFLCLVGVIFVKQLYDTHVSNVKRISCDLFTRYSNLAFPVKTVLDISFSNYK